ncbi:DUF1015 domain-containing protein [Magnetospirillum fulvum]|uniref:Uncharacterized conserved protein, DUF1015 family n=1 Tax=Magnetospirillum fulvum TaxID=1082 RepID=A0A1H6H9U1_MAGFU|nr:DUF1015 family protein [Magnetospirillum fulvum]SEH32571.1 Uncharacterized conserved protein, DUF1015 family [Magnetospirillum fulvum]
MSVPLLRPFPGLRPAAAYAAEMAAPPYDVLSSDEARVLADGHPHSFLHVSKAEIDLPPGTDPHDPAVYERAGANLRALIESGALIQDPGPRYYVYRLRMGEHVQTGIVGGGSVEDYRANRIRRHEFTRPDKEDDRVRQIEACSAQTGPVLLAHPDHSAVAAAIAATVRQTPDAEATTPDGVEHTVWVMSDPGRIAAVTRAFQTMRAVYIADGHHRSAAAARIAAARPDSDAAQSFLVVSFPIGEMRILDYNRVVTDLNGLDPDGFLAAIADAFEVEATEGQARPEAARQFGLYLAGQWYRLSPKAAPPDDPVAQLDVSLLSDRLLAPVLGIHDLRKDKRIDFVGGRRGLGELERRVDSGEMAAAFALFPTAMADLIAVADAGQVMPPKSTWFEPKLADGLVSYPLDQR